MGRQHTGPRYFASKKGWYVTINRKPVLLARGEETDKEAYQEATKRYHELMLGKGLPPARVDSIQVKDVVALYLATALVDRKPRTREIREYTLNAFLEEFGTRKVADLKLLDVSTWLARMVTVPRKHPRRGEVIWTRGTVRMVVTSIKAVFAWALESEVIGVNPMRKLKKPTNVLRDVSRLMTEADHQRIMAFVTYRNARDTLLALNDTGARPGEVISVKASDYRAEKKAWILTDHKLDRYGKTRVIYLTDRLVELTERLIKERPSGKLFRNCRGKPWRLKTLVSFFIRLRKQLGLNAISPYAYRHKFATEFLLTGGSIAMLAELMGNSVAVIQKHYGHLCDHGERLRQRLVEFRDHK